jgi:hypothetical protein
VGLSLDTFAEESHSSPFVSVVSASATEVVFGDGQTDGA